MNPKEYKKGYVVKSTIIPSMVVKLLSDPYVTMSGLYCANVLHIRGNFKGKVTNSFHLLDTKFVGGNELTPLFLINPIKL